jgi:hypothetical protein
MSPKPSQRKKMSKEPYIFFRAGQLAQPQPRRSTAECEMKGHYFYVRSDVVIFHCTLHVFKMKNILTLYLVIRVYIYKIKSRAFTYLK